MLLALALPLEDMRRYTPRRSGRCKSALEKGLF